MLRDQGSVTYKILLNFCSTPARLVSLRLSRPFSMLRDQGSNLGHPP